MFYFYFFGKIGNFWLAELRVCLLGCGDCWSGEAKLELYGVIFQLIRHFWVDFCLFFVF